MSRVLLSSAVCPILTHFSTFSRERHDFRKLVTEHKICAMTSLQFLSETFLTPRRTERDIIYHKCTHIFRRSTRYCCQITMKVEISLQIFEEYSISNFMKIRATEAKLFHTDGRTDDQTNEHTNITKLIGTFRNFVNTPNKYIAVYSA